MDTQNLDLNKALDLDTMNAASAGFKFNNPAAKEFATEMLAFSNKNLQVAIGATFRKDTVGHTR